MSLELMDFQTFIADGGLFIFLLVIGILLAVMTAFSFLIWQKGETQYFLKFITHLIATIAVLVGGVVFSIQYIIPSGSETIMYLGIFIFCVALPVAVGLALYQFIRNTWIKKEEQE